MVKNNELAFKAGELFNNKITSKFWSSFKGELGRMQASILVYLYDHKQAKSNELIEELNISKQHVSKIILDFIESGLLISEKAKDDRRSNYIKITAKGKKYIEDHFKISDESYSELLNSMSESEQKQFTKALETIVNILSKH